MRAPRALLCIPLQLNSGVRRLRLPLPMTQPSHPVAQLLEWLPESDFAVLEHGLAPHGRDYQVTVEHSGKRRPGRYRLVFTHVPEFSMVTEVRDEVWSESWTDVFTDYAVWERDGEPEGYVWGANWSLAHPGIKAIEPSSKAAHWSDRLKRTMYEAELATNQFCLRLVFHEIRTLHIDDRIDLISQVIIPLK